LRFINVSFTNAGNPLLDVLLKLTSLRGVSLCRTLVDSDYAEKLLALGNKLELLDLRGTRVSTDKSEWLASKLKEGVRLLRPEQMYSISVTPRSLKAGTSQPFCVRYSNYSPGDICVALQKLNRDETGEWIKLGAMKMHTIGGRLFEGSLSWKTPDTPGHYRFILCDAIASQVYASTRVVTVTASTDQSYSTITVQWEF
jgi:hypothetical protein